MVSPRRRPNKVLCGLKWEKNTAKTEKSDTYPQTGKKWTYYFSIWGKAEIFPVEKYRLQQNVNILRREPNAEKKIVFDTKRLKLNKTKRRSSNSAGNQEDLFCHRNRGFPPIFNLMFRWITDKTKKLRRIRSHYRIFDLLNHHHASPDCGNIKYRLRSLHITLNNTFNIFSFDCRYVHSLAAFMVRHSSMPLLFNVRLVFASQWEICETAA